MSRVFLPASRKIIEQQVRQLFPVHQKQRAHRDSPFYQMLHGYFNGKEMTFDLDVLDTSTVYPFQYLVLKAEHVIPYGRVSTYGALARRIKRAGAARAVGMALARNPFPIVIPCHRTVRADGSIGGFQGGTDMKRRLLELEGVLFTAQGKVARSCII
ncbi:methylated-DNA--[protein]-cysteine S-methyltransferase [candidate division WOR-3 bacterium]|nr:methylated-DNA--[protein]-cysteine S-methyltransferase [candidate division WOR-3 bacterium]